MAANPRKFSEKIALHTQKQLEETAAFEQIMREVCATRVSCVLIVIDRRRVGRATDQLVVYRRHRRRRRYKY